MIINNVLSAGLMLAKTCDLFLELNNGPEIMIAARKLNEEGKSK